MEQVKQDSQQKSLGEQIEEACAEASRLYDLGGDTTEIDRKVDALIARLEEQRF